MKPIDEMSDQEKLKISLDILILVDHWDLFVVKHDEQLYRIDIISKDKKQVWTMKRGESFFTTDDNGDPHFMALAWRVLNWAVTHDCKIDDSKSRVAFYGFADFGHLCREKIAKDLFLFMPPAEAQRLWLDKILSLAIEAGLCKDTAVSQEDGE